MITSYFKFCFWILRIVNSLEAVHKCYGNLGEIYRQISAKKPYNTSSKTWLHFIKFPVKDRGLEKSKKFLVFPWENYFDVSIQEKTAITTLNCLLPTYLR